MDSQAEISPLQPPPPQKPKVPSLIESAITKFREAKLTSGVRVEELFLKFCSTLEAKDGEGKLPDKYSYLSVEDFDRIKKLTNSPDQGAYNKYIEVVENEISQFDEEISHLGRIEEIKHYEDAIRQLKVDLENIYSHRTQEEVIAEIEYYQNKLSQISQETQTEDTKAKLEQYKNLLAQKLEELRLAETVRVIHDHEKQTTIVRSEDDLSTPIEGIGNNAVLYLTSDFHHAPSDVKRGIRAEYFQGYTPQRLLQKLVDRLKQRKRFGHIDEDNVVLRYVIQEEIRQLFYEWMADIISQEYSSEGAFNQATPIVVSLGDMVHDGAYYLDQLDAENKFYGLIDEIGSRIRKTPFLVKLFGNHDQDARIPESFPMLTELCGHQIFAKEISGVLVTAVDTNIENPEWISQFLKRVSPNEVEKYKSVMEKLEKKFGDQEWTKQIVNQADKIELKLLIQRKILQEKILEKMQQHEGSVLLLGHNPSRLIDSFAVKRRIIQNSNVERIIAGHTHNETHVNVPFPNKRGREIVMDVIESVVHDGIAPKLYQIPLVNGNIGQMKTLQEEKEHFARRYRHLQEVQEL